MTRQQLVEQIFSKKTYLCVGLDTDLTKIPKHLLAHPDPVFEFNKQIIDATKDYCVSYKINTAFYGKCHPWGHQELAVDPVRDRLRLHSKMTLTALADREILRLPKRLQPAINHFSLYFMKNLYLYFTG